GGASRRTGRPPRPRARAGEGDPPAPPAAKEPRAGGPAGEPPWRTVRTETAVEEPRLPEEELRPPEEPSLPRRAANDDRESIGQILRSLQRRRAHTSYVTATVFAGLRVLAGLVPRWLYLPELQSALRPTGLAAPVLAMLAVVFF